MTFLRNLLDMIMLFTRYITIDFATLEISATRPATQASCFLRHRQIICLLSRRRHTRLPTTLLHLQ